MGTACRRAAGRLALAMALGAPLAACADDPELVRGPTDSSPAASSTPAPDVASVAASRSAGSGRALNAVSNGTVTVVATTVGTFVSTVGEAGPPRQVGTFEVAVDAVSIALAPDGTWAAVAHGQPATVHWYDLVGSSPARRAQLPDAVGSLAVSAAGTLIAQSPTNVYAWPGGVSAAAVPLTDGMSPLGRLALLPDDRIVAPVTGTSRVLAGPATAALQPHDIIGLGEGTLVEAAASPAGTLAVVVGSGPNMFERTDQVAIVSTDTWQVTGSVPTGGRTEPDGWAVTDTHLAVAGPADTAVYTLDGQPAGTLIGAGESVFGWSSGLATISGDGATSFWNVSNLETPVAAGGAPALRTAIRPGPGTLSVTGARGEVSVWDAAGVLLASDDSFTVGEYTSLAVAGERIAVGTSAGRAFLFDLDLRPIATVVEDGRVDAVAFAPGTADVITARATRIGEFAFDDTVTRWSSEAGTATFRIDGAGQDVNGCAFFYNRLRISPDGKQLAFVKHTFEVALIDLADGSLTHTFPAHASTVLDVAFTDDGQLITTADDARVRVWNLADYSLAAEYPATMGGYYSVTPLGDGTAAVTDLLGTVSIIDLEDGTAAMTLPVQTYRAGRLARSPSGRLLGVPAADGTVTLWSTESRTPVMSLTGSLTPISELVFNDDREVIGAGAGGTLHVWSLEPPDSTG